MSPNRTFEDAVLFHGHRCPGLALGYRAAETGLAALGAGPSGDEEVVAVVENDACGVDGLQVRSGCTFGKGNLVFLDHGKHVYTFFDRRTGKGVRVVSRQDFSTARIDPGFGELRRRVHAGEADEAERAEYDRRLRAVCEAILALPADDLFTVGPATMPLPPEAEIHPSETCAACGESVAAHRVREVDGRRLCIPCAGR